VALVTTKRSPTPVCPAVPEPGAETHDVGQVRRTG